MSIQIVVLKLVLDKLNLSVVKDGIFICHKAVYLAQEAGIQLGYRFYWYLCGPKSDDCLDDLYSLYNYEKSIGESK